MLAWATESVNYPIVEHQSDPLTVAFEPMKIGRPGTIVLMVSVIMTAAISVAGVSGAAGDNGNRAGAAQPAPPATHQVSTDRPTLNERRFTRRVDRYGRFTAGADVSPRPANPFDPAEQTVLVILRAPDGRRVSATAYWFQEYHRSLTDGREVLTPVGTPYWKVRYTPDAPGVWRWHWVARSSGGVARGSTHVLHVRRRWANAGFLRVSPRDSRYLAHDDGSPYFAIGENLSWYDQRGTYAYDDWLDQLAAQEATWARLWMPAWAMGLEASDTGLGDYTRRLDRAWQLDHVMDAAAERGISIQLVLQYHGAFSTVFNSEWATNPYNAANGGPIATPAEFFTDPVARALFERRVRYVVARWGHATNLEAWELWNEVDLTDGYNSSAVAQWHREVATFIRSIDPAGHPITTSFAFFFNDPIVWRDSGLDLTQLHFYSQSGALTLFPDLARVVVDWPRDRYAETGRPVLFSELGVHSAGPAETVASDPEGIGVHDGLWAAAFGGSMGTAMPWWWDSVIAGEPTRYYPMFGSVATFLRDVPWDRAGFVVREPEVTTTRGRPVRAHLLAGDDFALLWVKDGGFRYDTPTRVSIDDAQVALDDLPGRWCAAWWNTWLGRWTSIASFDGGPGRRLTMPAFSADSAVRLAHC